MVPRHEKPTQRVSVTVAPASMSRAIGPKLVLRAAWAAVAACSVEIV